MLGLDGSLAGRCILVADSSYVLATATCLLLRRAGAQPVGPVPSVEKALLLIGAVHLDGAVLNSQLREGEDVQRLVDSLVEHRVPYMFLNVLPLLATHPLNNGSPESLYAGRSVVYGLAALLMAVGETPSPIKLAL